MILKPTGCSHFLNWKNSLLVWQHWWVWGHEIPFKTVLSARSNLLIWWILGDVLIICYRSCAFWSSTKLAATTPLLIFCKKFAIKKNSYLSRLRRFNGLLCRNFVLDFCLIVWNIAELFWIIVGRSGGQDE